MDYQRIYEGLPNVQVEELRIRQSDLNTKRMLDLMAVSSIQGSSMPLYLHVVSRILRDLRIAQQASGTEFNYGDFKRALMNEKLTDGQMAPLMQRLETLESFMVPAEAAPAAKGKSKKKGIRGGNDWSPKVCLVVVESQKPHKPS